MIDNEFDQLVIEKIAAIKDKAQLADALTKAIIQGYSFPPQIWGLVRYLQLDYKENNCEETVDLIRKRIIDNFDEIFKILTEEQFEEASWGNNFLTFLADELHISLYEGRIVKQSFQKEGRQCSVFAFPNAETRKHFELKWQKKVVSQFFRVGQPLQKGKQSYNIYTQLKNRQNPDEPFKIDGLCRRSFIIALSKILTDFGHMPLLNFQLGPTIIKLEPSDESSRQRQKGNFKLVIPGIPDIAYGEGCIKRITYLVQAHWDDSTNKKKRKSELLRHIKSRLQKFSTFDYRQFNKYGNINCFNEDFSNPRDSKILENIHLLNALIFLVTVVEVLVRLYRQEDGSLFDYKNKRALQSDSFPVAIAQTRSLQLLIAGKISFTDFFGETKKDGYNHEQHRAYYGAVTGHSTIDHIDIMYEKLCAINTLRNSLLPQDDGLKKLYSSYMPSNPEGSLAKGRSLLYFELTDIYGSGSESDSESRGYSDSEDSELNDVITYQHK